MGAVANMERVEVVGRYALYGEIAAGGMATVHFGKLIGPVGFSRPVAIKRLHPQLAKEENVRAMFIDEARLVSRIRHPNVVPVLDVIADDEQLLLVMEYVHGESLAKLARSSRDRRERIPLRIIYTLMSSVLHGLHAAHEARTENGEPLEIVHRDVTPQNIMVGVDGIARVLDFGIARATVRLESTREGVIKGKLAYMAPEQLGGVPVTRQADIYAAGVIMWELCAGRRLFLRGDDGQSVLIDKLLRGVIEPPSTHNPGLPPELDAIVMRALSREPTDRFVTARDMALAIERLGSMAPASEIGEWVESIAKDALSSRHLKIEAFERTSSKMRAAQSILAAEDSAVRTPDASLLSSLGKTTSAPPASADSLNPSHASIPILERSRSGSRLLIGATRPTAIFPIATAVLALGALGVFGASRAGAFGPRLEAPARTAVGAAVAAIPPPPSCPKTMRTIPGGKFFMGSDDGLPMEKPAHNVTLSPYCIDTFEVTTEDYKACSDRGECKRAGITNDWGDIADSEHKIFDPLCNAREPMARGKHPINCVDWEMAAQFCKAQGKRLPSEAEWEFAARGPDGRKYPWGDEEPGPTLLNACGKECLAWSRKNNIDARAMFSAYDGWATTAPVGSFPAGASRFGVQDVVGNVWEWVGDFYAEYQATESEDPSGPKSGDERVIRGGAWNGGFASWVRPTFRYKDTPKKRSYGIGFRCAKTL